MKTIPFPPNWSTLHHLQLLRIC
ncbi:hypothetical protein Gorai_003895, partial [Gossypium raimondii]|nr:hypothetical protein [Gossypium raimondii]